MNKTEQCVARYSLASIWILTGIISIGVYPMQASIALAMSTGVPADFAKPMVILAALIDIVFGIFSLTKTSKLLWKLQASLVIMYSLIIMIFLPDYLIHPFGPILKNLTVLALIWLLHNNEDVHREPIPTV